MSVGSRVDAALNAGIIAAGRVGHRLLNMYWPAVVAERSALAVGVMGADQLVEAEEAEEVSEPRASATPADPQSVVELCRAIDRLNERSEHPLYADIQDQAAAAVVVDVLADHYYSPASHHSIGTEGHCACGHRPRLLRDWQAHVAPLIVAQLGK